MKMFLYIAMSIANDDDNNNNNNTYTVTAHVNT